MALVGISSVTSLIIGLVLYYFAQDQAGPRGEHAARAALPDGERRARRTFSRACATPRTRRFPRRDLRRGARPDRSPTRRASRCSTSDPTANPWPPATASETPWIPTRPTGGSGSTGGRLEQAAASPEGEGRLVWSEGRSGYVAVWPLTARDGTVKGVLVYDVPQGRARGDARLPALRHPRGHTDERAAGRGGEPASHAPGHAPALGDPGRRHKGRLGGLRGRPCPSRAGTSSARSPGRSTTWPRR